MGKQENAGRGLLLSCPRFNGNPSFKLKTLTTNLKPASFTEITLISREAKFLDKLAWQLQAAYEKKTKTTKKTPTYSPKE